MRCGYFKLTTSQIVPIQIIKSNPKPTRFDPKTVKLNIKPAEYGEKIKLALKYKGKKIGKDSCDYNDEVWYSNRVTEGMTQKQVRYTWGAPSSTSSSSYGFTNWNWDDGSKARC